MLIIEDPRGRVQALDDPDPCWLHCSLCMRFFQYRDAKPSYSDEREGCPFADCNGVGLGFEIFVWDDLREPDDPRWPSRPEELSYGLRAPDAGEFYGGRRARLIAEFARSPEWRALQLDGDPRYVGGLCNMLSDGDYDLGDCRCEGAELWDLESLRGLALYCRSSDVGAVPAMVAELRAFAAFGMRARAIPEPEAWLELMSDDALEQTLREDVQRRAQGARGVQRAQDAQGAQGHAVRRAAPRDLKRHKRQARRRQRRARRANRGRS